MFLFISKEPHNMAFRDVGKINSLVVALVKKGTLPSKKKKRFFESGEEKRKRWFSTDGWTLETVGKQQENAENVQNCSLLDAYELHVSIILVLLLAGSASNKSRKVSFQTPQRGKKSDLYQ